MKRLSVDFSGDALNCVDYIAQELAICRGDALLHAIGLMRFFS